MTPSVVGERNEAKLLLVGSMLKKARQFFRRRKRVGVERIDEPPPPYGAVFVANNAPEESPPSYGYSNTAEPQVDSIRRSFAELDLLAQCNGCDDPSDESLQVHAEIKNVPASQEPIVSSETMGQKASMLTGHHRSKVSLTWVLRERTDVQYNPCNNQTYSDKKELKNINETYGQNFQRNNQKYDKNIIENDKEYFGDRSGVFGKNNGERIIGRNAKQFKYFTKENNLNNSKCKNNNIYGNYPDSCSENQADIGNNVPVKKHRHRRRRAKPLEKQESFGYEIKDIDLFLTEASIDNPGNIPVVVTYPSVLYQTQSGSYQKEMSLSLGMVVNAVFKNQQWLYVQTPHGEEGYILYASCLPLGILPPIQRAQSWKAPCWESTLDLYPQPCGNMTDSEKEQLRGGTKSECGRSRPKQKLYTDTMSAYSEKGFDKLYLKATSSCSKLKDVCDDKLSYKQSLSLKNEDNRKAKYSSAKKRQFHRENNVQSSYVTRHTLMVVEADFEGSKSINTLSVKKGEVVILVQGESVEADVDCEWFFVRNRDGLEGFIPAAIAGHGYL